MLILSANRFKNQPLPDPITAAFMQASGTVGTGSAAQLKLPVFAKGMAADLLRIEFSDGEYWATLLADVACSCQDEPIPTAADEQSAFLLQDGDALALGPFQIEVQIVAIPADPLAELIEADLQAAEPAPAKKPKFEQKAEPKPADGLDATDFMPSTTPLLPSAFVQAPVAAAAPIPPLWANSPSSSPAQHAQAALVFDPFAISAVSATAALAEPQASPSPSTISDSMFAGIAPPAMAAAQASDAAPVALAAASSAASAVATSTAASSTPASTGASSTPASAPAHSADDSQIINFDDLHASTADESLQALWDGLGLKRDAVAGAAVYPSEENMFRIGMLLRECVQGVATLMDNRQRQRQPLDLHRTQLIEIGNNPFKHQNASSHEPLNDLLRLLITNKLAGPFMPPAEAVKQSFDEVNLHFYALLQAQKQVNAEHLRSVAPMQLRADLEADPKGKRVTPAQLWEHYQKCYAQIEESTHTEYAYKRQLTDAYEAAQAQLSEPKR